MIPGMRKFLGILEKNNELEMDREGHYHTKNSCLSRQEKNR